MYKRQALDRSIIAYNENSDAEERERCREETETLAILTGLEIDSAKSGIRPDLDEYLTHKTVKRSDFLKYKTLVDEMETRRAWYEPTHCLLYTSIPVGDSFYFPFFPRLPFCPASGLPSPSPKSISRCASAISAFISAISTFSFSSHSSRVWA